MILHNFGSRTRDLLPPCFTPLLWDCDHRSQHPVPPRFIRKSRHSDKYNTNFCIEHLGNTFAEGPEPTRRWSKKGREIHRQCKSSERRTTQRIRKTSATRGDLLPRHQIKKSNLIWNQIAPLFSFPEQRIKFKRHSVSFRLKRKNSSQHFYSHQIQF